VKGKRWGIKEKKEGQDRTKQETLVRDRRARLVVDKCDVENQASRQAGYKNGRAKRWRGWVYSCEKKREHAKSSMAGIPEKTFLCGGHRQTEQLWATRTPTGGKSQSQRGVFVETGKRMDGAIAARARIECIHIITAKENGGWRRN